MIQHLHRWLPERRLLIVADGGSAVVEFLASIVTRMRVDAALDDSALQREAGKNGRPAVTGTR